VLAPEETPKEILQAVFRGMSENEALMADSRLIEVVPEGDFLTYGIGIPLMDMRTPEKSRGRAPVR